MLYAWHRPRGLFKQSIAEGGPIEQWRTERGRREMMAAAARLPMLREFPDLHGARVYFLSGERYWYQTLFCFVSLQIHTSFRVTPVVFDDGSLTDETINLMQRVVPWLQVERIAAIESRLDALLPETLFPALRARRRVYPHLRKLTDIHAGSTSVRAVLDSDMLFYNTPISFLESLTRSDCVFIQDVETSYGYPNGPLSAALGRPIKEPVNVGLYSLDGRLLEWARIEAWCAQQISAFGPHYLQEQALTAMALTEQDATPLDRSYVVKPKWLERPDWAASLHHYVSESKRLYYQLGWRRIWKLATTDHASQTT